jgi:hypothetical protein
VAIDLPPGVLGHAAIRTRRLRPRPACDRIGPATAPRQGDTLATDILIASVDGVLCLFGIKTLSPDQQRRFASKVAPCSGRAATSR